MIQENILYGINDIVIWTVKVENKNASNTGVFVSLSIPVGLTIAGSAFSHGSLSGNQWNIGTMIPNSSALGTIQLKLSSLPVSDQTMDVTATVTGIDTDPNNNTITDKVHYIKKCSTEPICNGIDDPCAEPSVNLIDYTEDVQFKISGKLPVRCDIGITVFSVSNISNCTVNLNSITGEYIVDLTSSNTKLPWSFDYSVSCAVKCFNRTFGPARVSGNGFCQPTVNANDESIFAAIGVPSVYNASNATDRNMMCEPVSWQIISDTTGNATINSSTGIINYIPQDNNETILWRAICIDGTTLDSGILSISAPPVFLPVMDGSGNELPCGYF